MAARKYNMDKRKATAAATRQRIVEATVALHSKKGIFGTSWQDIAQLADVSLATVYKHFPSLDELVPACGELIYAITQPPSLDDATEIFAEAHTLEERLWRLITVLFDFYERGAPYMDNDHQERQLPAVQEWEAHLQATIEGLAREALEPFSPDERVVPIVSAFLDFSTFKSFLARNIHKEQAAEAMNQVLLCWVNSPTHGRQSRTSPPFQP